MSESQCPSGFFSLFHSMKKQPLVLWEKKVRNGRVKRVRDEDLFSHALELLAPKSARACISCPSDPEQTLNVALPVLNMTVKNLHKNFAFEVQIIDSRHVKRRFRVATYHAQSEVKPFICKLPLTLEDGWNQITFPLQDFTHRCYGTNYVQTLRIQIYANCRLRRVFFSDRVCTELELPMDFKLNYVPLSK